jgi:AraC-like DNA-binding protein
MTLQYETNTSTYFVPAGVTLESTGIVDLSFRNADPVECELAVANRIGYSRVQARRTCRAAFGEPIASFIRRMRLERAAGYLSSTDLAISSVASDAGYCSSSAFSKAFCDHFECSPSEFRTFNLSADCLMPGFLMAQGVARSLPTSVRVHVSVDRVVTFLYDGPLFLARVLPSGQIDWRLP